MTALLSLPQLANGEVAIVEEIAGEPEMACRLASMGLCPGALVRMVMPGCPCAVQVGESRLMLRGEDLCAIRIAPL